MCVKIDVSAVFSATNATAFRSHSPRSLYREVPRRPPTPCAQGATLPRLGHGNHLICSLQRWHSGCGLSQLVVTAVHQVPQRRNENNGKDIAAQQKLCGRLKRFLRTSLWSNVRTFGAAESRILACWESSWVRCKLP